MYVVSPDRQLRITDDEISAVPFQEPRGHRAPIDLFFRSLAEQRGDDYPSRLFPPTLAGHDPVAHSGQTARARGPLNLHRLALEADFLPSILVDDSPRQIHLTETAGRYLQPRGGPLSADVLDLVRQELRSECA